MSVLQPVESNLLRRGFVLNFELYPDSLLTFTVQPSCATQRKGSSKLRKGCPVPALELPSLCSWFASYPLICEVHLFMSGMHKQLSGRFIGPIILRVSSQLYIGIDPALPAGLASTSGPGSLGGAMRANMFRQHQLMKL